MGSNVTSNTATAEMWLKKLIESIKECAMKTRDPRQELIGKLLNKWENTDYSRDGLKYDLVNRKYAHQVEMKLLEQHIPYVSFYDNYGNTCFLINNEETYEKSYEHAKTEVYMSYPEFYKELTPESFLDAQIQNGYDTIYTVTFSSQDEAERFKNKCFDQGKGFVVSSKEFTNRNEKGEFETKYEVYISGNAIHDMSLNDLSFMDAVLQHSISTSTNPHLNILKDAAILSDRKVMDQVARYIRQDRDFTIADEKDAYADYIQYDAEQKLLTTYTWNKEEEKFVAKASIDVELDERNRPQPEALHAINFQFSKVNDGCIYTAQEFKDHQRKSPEILLKEYKEARFKEYDMLNNVDIGWISVESESQKLKESIAAAPGRPAYDKDLIQEYIELKQMELQQLDDTYGFGAKIQAISGDGKTFLKAQALRKEYASKVEEIWNALYKDIPCPEILNKGSSTKDRDSFLHIVDKLEKEARMNGKISIVTELIEAKAYFKYEDLQQVVNNGYFQQVIDDMDAQSQITAELTKKLESEMAGLDTKETMMSKIEHMLESPEYDRKEKEILMKVQGILENTDDSLDVHDEMERLQKAKEKVAEKTFEKEDRDWQ